MNFYSSHSPPPFSFFPSLENKNYTIYFIPRKRAWSHIYLSHLIRQCQIQSSYHSLSIFCSSYYSSAFTYQFREALQFYKSPTTMPAPMTSLSMLPWLSILPSFKAPWPPSFTEEHRKRRLARRIYKSAASWGTEEEIVCLCVCGMRLWYCEAMTARRRCGLQLWTCAEWGDSCTQKKEASHKELRKEGANWWRRRCEGWTQKCRSNGCLIRRLTSLRDRD